MLLSMHKLWRFIMKRIAIIGAGPIGLEAALYARHIGYDVTIYEKETLASNVRKWGHVTFFSPFSMNASALGRHYVSQNNDLPDENAYLTGADFYEGYLKPLAENSLLKDCLKTNVEVVAISRTSTLKRDLIGDPKRATFPFRLLLRNEDGKEWAETADVVLDCSGTWSNPNWLGEGGIPAVGERSLREELEYGIADLLKQSNRFAEKSLLLVGSGHSAATTLAAFKELHEKSPSSKLIWMTRADEQLTPIENDPLAERTRIIEKAALAAKDESVQQISGANIQSVAKSADGGYEVTYNISGNGDAETIAVDEILACIGHSPDNSIYRELQIHECYASRGPMSLAAALLGDSSADCLDQSSKGPEVLKNPEPGFFILGMKSYGTSPNFLLRIGHEQVRDVFKLINEDEQLDKYAELATA
ncbi:MAG: FAD-dependent oxidoreductase [Calditrichota bacterium]